MSWSTTENIAIRAEDVKLDFLEKKERIVIGKLAKKKIKILLKLYPNLEWMAACIGEKDSDGDYWVEDLVILEQEVTGSHTEFSLNGNKEMSGLQNCIGAIHSHNTMKVFFSGTDWETAEMHTIFLCVNNDYDFFGSIRTGIISLPGSNVDGKRLLKDADVIEEKDEEDEDPLFSELKKICDEKIKERTFTSNLPSYYRGRVYSKEYSNDFDSYEYGSGRSGPW